MTTENATERVSKPKRVPLWIQIVIGLILGCVIGALWPKFGTVLLPFGTAFIKAIKMIVIPLVFSAVTLGIYKMSANFKTLGRLAGLAFGWFYFATGCSRCSRHSAKRDIPSRSGSRP